MPSPKFKMGDKVRCIVGAQKPGNTEDHNRGGTGWQIGREFVIGQVTAGTSRSNGDDVLFYTSGYRMFGVYADWVEIVKPKMGDMADNRPTKLMPKDILRGSKWDLK